MKRFSWLVAGAVAGIALMLACEMQSDPGSASVGPGGSAHADETDGVQRVMTAETDPAQQISGSDSDPIGELVEGPAFVTDVRIPFGGNSTRCALHVAPAGESCPNSQNDATLLFGDGMATASVLTNARIFVPAGQMLCARPLQGIGGCSPLSWSGYRPYE